MANEMQDGLKVVRYSPERRKEIADEFGAMCEHLKIPLVLSNDPEGNEIICRLDVPNDAYDGRIGYTTIYGSDEDALYQVLDILNELNFMTGGNMPMDCPNKEDE